MNRGIVRRSGARRSEAGFSLVEIIVGIVLMSIGILAMAALAVAVAEANRDATNRTRADQLLHEKVEGFRSTSYSAIVDGEDTVDMGGVEIVRSWTVTVDEPMNDIKRIDLEGSWLEKGVKTTTSTATYIGKY